MRTKMITILAAGLAGLVLGCGDEESSNDNEPGEMTPEDKLVMALGGPELVDGLQGVTLEATGTRYLTYEGSTPSELIQANTFTRTVSVDVDNDFFRVDTQRQRLFLFPGMEEYVDIVRGEVGATTQTLLGGAFDLQADKVAAIRMQETLLNPHVAYARFAESGLQEDRDVQQDGVVYHRLVVTGASPEIALYVNADTGELAWLQTMELDFFTRDVMVRVTYDGWQTTESGAGYPSSVTLSSNGLDLITQQVQSFEANPAFADGTFEIAPASASMPDSGLFSRGVLASQWYFQLDSIGLPFMGVDTSITPVEVAEGVEQLQGGSHHSFLVEQENGLVLVDAPLHDDRGQALFEYIQSQYPNKPITHVVASHFHEDHASGIREVLGQTEASLVVHESTAGFWSNVLRAPSTISPDALSTNPRQVPIVTVPDDGELTLDDPTHAVTLYDMNAEHAADLLLTHEASSNAVFVVDIYSPGNPAQFEAATLNQTIVDNALDTETLQIVGGHGPEIHDYATLEGFLE